MSFNYFITHYRTTSTSKVNSYIRRKHIMLFTTLQWLG